MLFSATFPVAVRKLARSHLAESHIRVRVGRVGSTHQNIAQDVIFTDPAEKKRCLLDLLRSMKPARTIIFVNSKQTADEIDDYLFHNDFPSTSMHGDRTQREREDSMRAFRSGKAPIMVATGLSARGIDVRNVGHVVNYDLPSMEHGGIQEYIHRIGKKHVVFLHTNQDLANYEQVVLAALATVVPPLLSTLREMSPSRLF